MAEFKIARLRDLSEGCGLQVDVGGDAVALFRVQGKVYATSGTCPHKGGPLGDGEVNNGYVSCPWHGWQFEIMTGQCHGRASKSIITYPVRVDSEYIYIEK
ncbi:MAG: Rieske 2Fe-2S domain-containing protein [Myxococcales bacterium]|nr:Rieske 2Fe-2S domain-containing protein [Myxococcales bacterium]